MSKQLVKVGTTSQRMAIFIADATSSAGAGLSGLAFNSAGLTWYYWREDDGNAGGTAVTLATATRGTFTSGGFVEKDATNMAGCYEIGIPNAALASGAGWVVMMLAGATNMTPVTIEIQLVAFDPEDTVRLGLTALPNAAAAANGGLPTVDAANSVKIQTALKKNIALNGFTFYMTDSSGNAATGLTITATRSLDGAAFASCANAVAEIANGWYKIDLATTDTNGNTIALKFTASGARQLGLTLLTQA